MQVAAGWRYGTHGKVYKQRCKAVKQGQAIAISKRRASGENIPIKGSIKRRGTIRRRLN